MTIQQFLEKLKITPTAIEFAETMAVVDTNYNFEPTTFTNGTVTNKAGENSGSCKLFAFAKTQALSKEETLYCFGEYYKDVVDTPTATDHQNIRNFMRTGWEGISFDTPAITAK